MTHATKTPTEYSAYKAILVNTMHNTRCVRGERSPVVATGEVMAKEAVTVMATEVAKEAATVVATVVRWRQWKNGGERWWR